MVIIAWSEAPLLSIFKKDVLYPVSSIFITAAFLRLLQSMSLSDGLYVALDSHLHVFFVDFKEYLLYAERSRIWSKTDPLDWLSSPLIYIFSRSRVFHPAVGDKICESKLKTLPAPFTKKKHSQLMRKLKLLISTFTMFVCFEGNIKMFLCRTVGNLLVLFVHSVIYSLRGNLLGIYCHFLALS